MTKKIKNYLKSFWKYYILRKPKFYKIKKSEIKEYQKYFNEILKKIDIYNTTEWLQFQRGNFKKYDIDSKKIFEKLEEIKKNKKISSLYLQMMVDQYIFADVWIRERNKDSWVEIILKRKSDDFFPDPWSIYHNFYIHE
ncbi:MAG: hypothetical protein U9O55_01895 [Patescibacteria group bacterium]|nr:hypothetical protein [Patescibacteria group bacterium]